MGNYHLGINLGHDRAAAIVRDGEIVIAIEQERLDRQKHSIGILQQSGNDPSHIQLPYDAVNYCLAGCGITMSSLSSVTANMPGIDYSTEILRRTLAPEWQDKIRQMPSHHLSHAYSAYWPSGFDRAIVLVADGVGTATLGGTILILR
jgi:carbamoyltransferase